MKHAYLIEMTVLRDYAWQLLGTGLFMAVCMSLGMRSVLAVPGMLIALYLIIGCMAGPAYDEQNNWGLFLLTMPVSRRDVVRGRYGFIVTMGGVGLLAGLVGTLGLSAIASVVPLPGSFAEAFVITPDALLAMLTTIVCCTIVGVVVASVETPIYFRFGQTKTTQWLPMITVLIFIVSMLTLGSFGVLDNIDMSGLTATVEVILATPAAVVAVLAGLVAASVAILGLSMALSMRLYAHREL